MCDIDKRISIDKAIKAADDAGEMRKKMELEMLNPKTYGYSERLGDTMHHIFPVITNY